MEAGAWSLGVGSIEPGGLRGFLAGGGIDFEEKEEEEEENRRSGVIEVRL